MTKKTVLFWMAALMGAMALQGCVSVRSNHGYVLERGTENLTANIGLDTKESIIAKYGEPSMISTFSTNSWYYLNSRDQTRAFLKPKTQDRKIVAFNFDEEGKVSSVEEFTIEDGERISMVSRVTPTRGKELSFWEQLLGSVGQLPIPGADGQGGVGGQPGRP
ncbi:MAG: outer membrane protein assembly factor BamE [Pseudomonadota bacterium]